MKAKKKKNKTTKGNVVIKKNNKSNSIKKKSNKTSDKDKNKKDEKVENNENKDNKKIILSDEFNAKIQSIVSIAFTVVIFIALFFLIFVLYNNYIKPKNKDLDKLCEDYLPKDYNITTEMIDNFIKNSRSVIYNLEDFELNNITSDDIRTFATYFIWGNVEEYTVCDEDDSKCLVTKMEMKYSDLKKYFKNYLGIDDVNISFNDDFLDDDQMRLYMEDDKVVLTFSEFVYQSYIHNLVYRDINEDKIILTFALTSNKDNASVYQYKGYKTITLKYKDKNFIIESIKTSLTD